MTKDNNVEYKHLHSLLMVSFILDQKHICQNMEQYGHGKGTPYGGMY